MIDLNGIKIKNRVWLAAGAGGYGEGWPHQNLFIKLGLIDFSAFGAVITRTLTPELRHGNYIDPLEFENATFMSQMSQLCPVRFCFAEQRGEQASNQGVVPKRGILATLRAVRVLRGRIFSKERKRVLRKVPGGWINNMSWWNVGINYWIEKIYPRLKNVAIIPSIGGFAIEHYLESIKKLDILEIAAIEINISCPNVEHSLAKNLSEIAKLFASCRWYSRHPLIVKLGIDSDYLQIAKIAEQCGFNAVSGINAIPALGGPPLRGEARSVLLSGGYSGPAIKPIALKAVSDIKKEIKIPVIGGGGIASKKDCDEFFELAGVDAVALGSGFILKPWEPNRIIRKYNKQDSE